jgi:hypothetical protein
MKTSNPIGLQYNKQTVIHSLIAANYFDKLHTLYKEIKSWHKSRVNLLDTTVYRRPSKSAHMLRTQLAWAL